MCKKKHSIYGQATPALRYYFKKLGLACPTTHAAAVALQAFIENGPHAQARTKEQRIEVVRSLQQHWLKRRVHSLGAYRHGMVHDLRITSPRAIFGWGKPGARRKHLFSALVQWEGHWRTQEVNLNVLEFDEVSADAINSSEVPT